MTRNDAVIKASAPIQASNGSADAYQIASEETESVKSLVGHTYQSPNGHTFTVEQWIGQNYVIRIDTDNYDAMPAVYLLSRISHMTQIN